MKLLQNKSAESLLFKKKIALKQQQLLGGMSMVVKHISSKNCLMSPSQLSGLYRSQNSLVNLRHHQNF